MAKKTRKKRKGFSYYRTREQLIEYMNVAPIKKLEWLEEMYEFNRLVALHNPHIGKIQEMFRKGEI